MSHYCCGADLARTSNSEWRDGQDLRFLQNLPDWRWDTVVREVENDVCIGLSYLSSKLHSV